MTGRETVHEVEATATLTLALPRERGGELRTVAAERLETVDPVRHAAVADLGEVDAHEDGLDVTVEAALTLQFDAPGEAEGAADRLSRAVAALDSFDVVAGPYEIEAW
jgi:hypothetical protein